ncbi:MAG: LysE family translocator [Lautropia sp.]
MDLHLWLIYLAAAVGLSLTPGPNGLLALTHGMRFGWRPTLHTALGGIAGFMLLVAASIAGLGALLATSERAFEIAKWIGAAYLVYLGVRTWRAPPPLIDVAPAGPASGDDGGASLAMPSARRRFAEGFMVAVSNPKALIFFAAFLPQFMQPDLPLWQQFAILGGTFGLVELAYELLIASAAQRVAPWLGRHGRWFNRTAGATFIGIGGALGVSSR